jgi:uncharacterized coiled-coil protein SlyX
MNALIAKILEGLQGHRSAAEIASEIPWAALNARQRDDLLAYAKKIGGDRQAYDYLRVLVHISKDDMYSLQVLELASQHPSLTVSARQGLLHNMRRILDRRAGSPKTPAGEPGLDYFEGLYQRLQAPFAAFSTAPASGELAAAATQEINSPVKPFTEAPLSPAEMAQAEEDQPLLIKINAQRQILTTLEKQVEELEKRLAWLTSQIQSAETTLQRAQQSTAPPHDEMKIRESSSKVPPFVDQA